MVGWPVRLAQLHIGRQCQTFVEHLDKSSLRQQQPFVFLSLAVRVESYHFANPSDTMAPFMLVAGVKTTHNLQNKASIVTAS